MGLRSGRLRRLLSLAAAAAIASGMLATQAAADVQPCSQTQSFQPPKTGTLVADCMTADQVKDPPGSDSPGEGTATIWIDININQLAYEVHTAGLTFPIHGAMVYEGDEGEVGPKVFPLFGTRFIPNPSGCHADIDPELRDLLQKSKPFYLEIYDDLWNDGAIRGQLVYTDKSGTPDPGICES